MDNKNRGVRALLAASTVSRCLRTFHLSRSGRHLLHLHVTLVALVQADLVAQQVLDLLSPQVLVVALRQEWRLVREALLLAEHDVPLLMLHVSRQGRLQRALTQVLGLCPHGSVRCHAQARMPAAHAAGQPSGGHESQLAPLIVGANGRVELAVLRIPMLIVVRVLADGVLSSEVHQTLVLADRAVLPHRRIMLLITHLMRALPLVAIGRLRSRARPLATLALSSLH